MSLLASLLSQEAISTGAKADDWREAIRLAGCLLEKTGAITGEYTDAMIASVEENGPYIVVAPGFAFAHARPSDAVTTTALSWVQLDTPVRFGHPDNDPVRLVVALAATDSTTHLKAMSELARLLRSEKQRSELDSAATADEILALVDRFTTPDKSQAAVNLTPDAAADSDGFVPDGNAVPSTGKILTVCGNGLGTSLFLKNTLEQVLGVWGWAPFISVEATDTISAKGKAKEADCILTSGEIAKALGDLGVPMRVISDFTSESEVDAALRDIYDV
ncbi:PTS sugar transporter subunit IIA [Corynebacterium mendelii]|uniref:Ascorbate-specific PTS system EIIA component n=1 Tax=Corynebacterium mendelii TaxID=2765362 RepID=A0A939E2K5_9CORY|nr:PTS sugar transporter subunit IIA [Corynebacterium mendelii]MBN9644613.1 PTS sugar transporter subunit IIA [Corynebacterium mendelii]